MAERENQLKEQVFSAKHLYRQIQQASHHHAKQAESVVFNDMVQLAKGNPAVDDATVLRHINHSVVLRRQYMQVLEKLAFAVSPIQAAASSELEMSSRRSAEFELLFKRDLQFSEQVYVILKIPHPTESQHNQGVKINCCSADLISTLHFPPIVDGKTQLLMEESDPKFINMFDTEFALYLS